MGKSEPNDSKICILLTATVDPKGVVFMKRSDPLIRENDYVSSIKKWISNTTYPILFCENSNYQLDKLKDVVRNCKKDRIEILQFDGQSFPREFGKGYGELNTIKYAIKHSQIMKDSDYVIKINGRYFIKNIEKIANILSSSKNIYAMVDLKKNLTWGNSRIFAFKVSFILNYLSKFQDLLNDSKGFYFEHALARAILRSIADGYKWMPLPVKPIIIGYSGTSDTKYESSKARWLIGEVIHKIKNYLNRR